jgi:hypothetical protein
MAQSDVTRKLLLLSLFKVLSVQVYERASLQEEGWRKAMLPENCYFCHFFKFWVYKFTSMQVCKKKNGAKRCCLKSVTFVTFLKQITDSCWLQHWKEVFEMMEKKL